MSWTRFVRRARWDDERRRELDSYVQIEVDDNLARGMNPRDARAAAYRSLGNPTLVREEIYRMNSLTRLEAITKDVAYALRLLRRSPGFTVVAVLSLALGVGANSALFRLVDAVRLRSLPVDRPQDIVEVKIVNATNGRTGDFVSRHPAMTNPIWERVRDEQQVFATTMAWSSARFNLADSGESREIPGIWVSGDYFAGLDVRPVAGRLIDSSDDRRGCGSPVAVLGEGFWHRQYGGATSAIGSTIDLDGHPFTIIGVSPAAFLGVEVGHGFDVAAPICAEPIVDGADSVLDKKDGWWLGVLGRLKPGVSIDRASAQLAAISPAIFASTVADAYDANDGKDYRQFLLGAVPAGTGVTELRRAYEQPLWMLLAISGVVLVIACGNLANLLLARASARSREMAIRLAIGASRGRLLRQLMAESLLLALLGGLLGAWLAQVFARTLIAFLSTDRNPLAFDLAIDWRVLAFTAGVAALTCVAFGLAPAVRATRTSPTGALRAAGRGLTDSRERFGLRRALVVAQLALSLVLLVSAGLFVRTFWNLATLDPGFRTSGILVARIDFHRAEVPPAEQGAYQQRLVDRLAGLPGVDEAASTTIVPLSGSGSNNTVVIDGTPRKPYPNISTIGRDYFRVLNIPIVAGRSFTEHDTAAAAPVAIVTRAFARAYFDGRDPVGRTFQFPAPPGKTPPSWQIVGMVADSRYQDPHDDIGPIIYFPGTQEPHPGEDVSVVMHTGRTKLEMAPAILAAIHETSPTARVTIATLTSIAGATTLREALMAALSAFFAVLAALLAAVGLYGVIAYGVAQRRAEIGLRMALGADRSRILRLVLSEAMMLVGVGLAIGATLAWIAGRFEAALLFALNPHDGWTFAAALALLIGVAGFASFFPAWRASWLMPTEAIREP